MLPSDKNVGSCTTTKNNCNRKTPLCMPSTVRSLLAGRFFVGAGGCLPFSTAWAGLRQIRHHQQHAVVS
jgi:hypothetical protein